MQLLEVTTPQLAKEFIRVNVEINKSNPNYIHPLEKDIDVKSVFDKIRKKYKSHPVNTEDRLKIEFDNDWVHLRTSNTEPIIRIYAESNFETTADNIANRLIKDIQEAI